MPGVRGGLEMAPGLTNQIRFLHQATNSLSQADGGQAFSENPAALSQKSLRTLS
jgi:hypothetical protein